MTLAAKHMDPVMGIDMHMVQPPPPAPPVMIPVPFVGYLIDPADYSGGCTIHVNGLPRARAGTPGMGCPPHVPPGGVFVKPPTNECEMYQGSSTVIFDGDAASNMTHQVLGCHDVGMVAPARPWKQLSASSPMMASCSVLPVASLPVLVGGAPTIILTTSGKFAEDECPDPPNETVDVEVYDELGAPLASARFELRLPDGDVEEGTLDEGGAMQLRNVPAGYAIFVLLDVDVPGETPVFTKVAESWTGTKRETLSRSRGGPEVSYVVSRNGETLRQICALHGFRNWRSVYLHQANEELRDKKANPHYLLAGDVVRLEIPLHPVVEYRRGGIAVPSGQRTVIHVSRFKSIFQFSC